MKNKRRTLTLLALIFALSVFMKYTIIYSQVPEGAIVDWGDEWSFLSQIEIIKMTYKLPAEDLFFGGIPYVYPPLSLMIYALLYMIIPIGYVSLANNVMPVVGSLAVFSIFYLTYSMTKNENMGILAAYLSLFAPRYMALSSVPIPEMLAHILAPIFILTVWKMADTKDKNYALLAGIAGASIILTHHLTTAVVFIPVFLYIFLLSVIRRNPVYVKLLVIMCATAFLMSSPWWIDTINKDIMNLIVREQEQSIPPLEHYLQQLGPQVFILGIPAILAFAVYGTWKRDERILLIFSWGFVSLFATQSRAFVGTVLGLDSHSNLYLILAPIYGERYFDYMAQPFAIMIAVVLVSAIYYLSSPLKGFLKKKTGDDRVFGHVKIKTAICLFIMVPLVISTLQFGFDKEDNWSLFRLTPDVNNGYEYPASLWMRDNLPADSMILTDYPGGEVVTGGALMKIITGSELRVTVDIVPIYNDVVSIYYTRDIDVAMELMRKRNITHVYISDRMIERGWFPITAHSNPDYKFYSGMTGADVEKFEVSECFVRLPYADGRVIIYEFVC